MVRLRLSKTGIRHSSQSHDRAIIMEIGKNCNPLLLTRGLFSEIPKKAKVSHTEMLMKCTTCRAIAAGRSMLPRTNALICSLIISSLHCIMLLDTICCRIRRLFTRAKSARAGVVTNGTQQGFKEEQACAWCPFFPGSSHIDVGM